MVTFTDVGKEVNLSTTTVMRTFDLVSYAPRDLPNALSIDEFKGNTNGEKYQCIITDPVNKIVLDILPKRYESYLTKYFLKYDKTERNKITTFVSDMWSPYASMASKMFNVMCPVRQTEIFRKNRTCYDHVERVVYTYGLAV